VSNDPDVADAATATTVLTYSQPQSNHNGGWLGFGPSDGLLYISTGDGGGGDDNDAGRTAGIGNGQDITDNLLGKILRIDVNGDDFPADAGRNYAIPTTNPFVGTVGDDEIWA
jgi:glucose/arabinose dehydrogenase